MIFNVIYWKQNCVEIGRLHMGLQHETLGCNYARGTMRWRKLLGICVRDLG